VGTVGSACRMPTSKCMLHCKQKIVWCQIRHGQPGTPITTQDKRQVSIATMPNQLGTNNPAKQKIEAGTVVMNMPWQAIPHKSQTVIFNAAANSVARVVETIIVFQIRLVGDQTRKQTAHAHGKHDERKQ
jgi:hypothetical protein